MRILLFSMELKGEARNTYQVLVDALQSNDCTLFQYNNPESSLLNHIPIIYTTEQLKNHKIDMVISAGGDGTMLKAVSFGGDSGIPFLGFNLGRLGFLAVIEKDDLYSMVRSIKSGFYTLEPRTTICIQSNAPVFEDNSFGLNDFTLLKRDNSSMIKIHTTLNNEFLNTYWADGLILATPTGSTGYSLSCGGPIIFPQSGNFVLTPIAPHNLNVRPIVISDDSVLEFKVEGRTENFLCTLDSKYGLITSEHIITLKRNAFDINLVKIQGTSFLKTLRDKLMWGLDLRN
ncbi:MAG: NAD kinase [Saprospiraceae bacterium]